MNAQELFDLIKDNHLIPQQVDDSGPLKYPRDCTCENCGYLFVLYDKDQEYCPDCTENETNHEYDYLDDWEEEE